MGKLFKINEPETISVFCCGPLRGIKYHENGKIKSLHFDEVTEGVPVQLLSRSMLQELELE